jgi:hypothetical protein
MENQEFHLHVGKAGALLACRFEDQTDDEEFAQLDRLLPTAPAGSLEELRYHALTHATVKPIPDATMPVCRYWGSDKGCDGYRFWIEPMPEGQFAPGMVCGEHIVDWTVDYSNLASEWSLKDWVGTPTYPDDNWADKQTVRSPAL